MAKASARHILVNTQEECEGLKTKIEGGEDFGEIAKQHSQCPSGQKGGLGAAATTGRRRRSVTTQICRPEVRPAKKKNVMWTMLVCPSG